MDRLDVFHIGDNGYVWGPGVSHRFPSKNVHDLLWSWLHISELGGIAFHLAPERIEFEVPVIEEKGVTYRREAFAMSPLGTMPFESSRMDKQNLRTESHWPPKGVSVPTVSPDQESREYFGKFSRDPAYPDLPIFRQVANPARRTIQLLNRWPSPFTNIASLSTGFDDMKQEAQMVAIAKSSHSSPEKALLDAREQSREHLSEGISTWEHAYLMPIYAKEGEQGALFAAHSRFNVDANSIPELLSSPAWAAQATAPIAIRRAWGMAGLMWALFLDELEAFRTFRACDKCGSIVNGRANRKYCDPLHNPECAKSRQRSRQGKTRARKSKRQA